MASSSSSPETPPTCSIESQQQQSDRGRAPIESLIQGEIERRLKSKPWNKLDMCFKWRLVSSFLSEHGVLDGLDEATRGCAEAELRERIRRNDLDGVRYDNATMKILEMDVGGILEALG